MAGAVYWIGQDGNIWLKDATGTRNVGPAGANITRPDATGFYDPWADNTQTATRFNATQIADPATHVLSASTTAPTGGTATKPLDTAAIGNTQKTIDQIPALLQAALASEDQTFNNTNAGFDAQEAAQRGTYGASSDTNQNNYDSNFMDSIRAGIKGLHGLFALLAGSGAAGGTAEDLARDTVGGVTSNDIRGGADTRDANQTALDSSLTSFLTDLKGKRQTNADTHVNNARAINRDSSTNLQDLYSKMAGFYSDAGDTADATSWMNRAGNLTPDIAANSRTQVSPYDNTPVVVHAPNLTAFAAPTQPSVVTAPNDGQVGSGIFTIQPPDSKRKTEDTPAPALAGV
jgi:hypothetical protein